MTITHFLHTRQGSVTVSKTPLSLFEHFFAAILSVINDVSVESSAFNPGMQFDPIMEEDEDPEPEDDVNDSSGSYPGSSNKGTLNPL